MARLWWEISTFIEFLYVLMVHSSCDLEDFTGLLMGGVARFYKQVSESKQELHCAVNQFHIDFSDYARFSFST